MYAIAKGMGYKGAYISGQGLPFESVEYIVSMEMSSPARGWIGCRSLIIRRKKDFIYTSGCQDRIKYNGARRQSAGAEAASGIFVVAND